VKSKVLSQIATFGMPIMAIEREDKANIRELEKIYYKMLDLKEDTKEAEYIERRESGILYAETDDKYTIIVMMRCNMNESDAVNAKEKIKKLIVYDQGQFFISDYK